MLGNELVAALQQCFFKTYFAGIFSSDNIPKRLKNKHELKKHINNRKELIDILFRDIKKISIRF